MKIRLFLSILMVFLLLISGCTVNRQPLSESPSLPNDGEEQETIPIDSKDDTSIHDEFQDFLEKWNLYGLIPQGLTLTTAQQEEFLQYFQQFDAIEHDYILLFLQGISTGQIPSKIGYHDFDSGVYLYYCSFFLYDMNQDDFPEMILKTGGCEADFWYTVFTIEEGKLINCGGLSAGHAGLYTDGSGQLVRYSGHMGVYEISLSWLEGTTLITEEIAQGVLEDEEDYPALEAYGYGNYDQRIEFSGIPTLFLAALG